MNIEQVSIYRYDAFETSFLLKERRFDVYEL